MDFYTSVTRLGERLLIRGYKDGKRNEQIEHYEPVLYSTCKEEEAVFRTIDGKAVKPVVFDSMTSANERLKAEQQFGSNSIYGFENFASSWIAETWVKKVPFDRSLIRIGWIDIEVQSDKGFPYPHLAKRKITAITLKVNGKVYCWGLAPYTSYREDVIYYEFTRETMMLEHFIEKWRKLDIDILSGWNIEQFDVPYIINRLTNLWDFKKACRLSPHGWCRERKVRTKFGEYQTYDICGIQIIDYMLAYKKYKGKSQEMYKLGYIGQVEEVGDKIDYHEFATLAELYVKDHQKFIDYNIRDVELCERLNNKLRYLDVVIALAYHSKVNFQDTFMQTRMWDSMVYNHLINKGIVIPVKMDAHRESLEGAYVKEPQVAKHKWIVGFDATSLYPSSQLMFNISPDTLITEDQMDFRIEDVLQGRVRNDTNWILAGNGHFFERERRGFMPEIIDDLFQQRQSHKKQMLAAEKRFHESHDQADDLEASYHNSMQNAMKVCLNSCYGTMGSPFFRFYDVRLASAITLTGQLAVQWARDKINAYLNKLLKTKGKDFVIASDTDSIYVRFDELVSLYCPDSTDDEKLDFVDKITSERIKKVLDDGFEELRAILNAPKSYLNMKRETISDVGFWKGKKRYVLDVLIDETGRLPEPKIKITGLEAVRSSTPQISRDAIKKGIKIMLKGTQEEAWAFIAEMKAKFDTLPIEDIANPKGVSEIKKWIDHEGQMISGTPIQVRASHTYNLKIHEMELNTKYEEIREGDKMKFVYLTEPNPLRQDVIGFSTLFPTEFNLEEYVDRDKQFYKLFYKPFAELLAVIGWEAEKRGKIGRFYSGGNIQSALRRFVDTDEETETGDTGEDEQASELWEDARSVF